MSAVILPAGYCTEVYSSVRSLSVRGVDAIVASKRDTVPAGFSRFANGTVTVPDPREDVIAYKDALVDLAARPDARTIVPLREEDPYVFATYRGEFEPHVSLPTPSASSLETVHDRLRLAEVAEDAGVAVPETRHLDDGVDWDRERVVKSRYNVLTAENCPSYSARDVGTVKRVTYLCPDDRPDPEAFRTEMDHAPIVQEYVAHDDQYVVGALYDEGEPLATFQHRQIRGSSYTGGGGVYRESVAVPELEASARRLLDRLDWHGLACLEFMRERETGEFVLAEINPRSWQSLPCAIRAGADFPYYYYLLATGRGDEIEPGYETGVRSHLLYGEAGYLLSVFTDDSPFVDRPSPVRTAGEIAASCVATPTFDILRADDPFPWVYDFGHRVRKRL